MHISNIFYFRILINNGDQNTSIHMGGSQKLIIMINITSVHVTLVIYNTHSLSRAHAVASLVRVQLCLTCNCQRPLKLM